MRCDGTDRAAVGSLLADIWAQEGPVDVAFCNAGSGGMSPIIETAVEEIDAQFQVNFLFRRAFDPAVGSAMDRGKSRGSHHVHGFGELACHAARQRGSWRWGSTARPNIRC